MLNTLAALIFCLASVNLLERFVALPKLRRGRPWRAVAMAMLAVLVVFLFWFALSWRPLFTAFSTVTTFTIVTLISNFKYDVLFEPLSFADFCLAPQVVRHPDLYYAEFLYSWPFGAAMAALLGAIAAWFSLEPTVIPPIRFGVPLAGLAGLIAFGAALGTLWGLGRWPISSAALRRLAPGPNIRDDTGRFGLFGGMAIHLTRWLATPPGRETPWPTEPHPHWPLLAGERLPPLIVAIQSESFVDLGAAGFGPHALPNLERARRRALAHGRLVVPTAGAWTMRSEYSFLTGRPLSDYRFDALDPYLRSAFGAPETAAQRLGGAGFEAAFVHPFDIRFFQRHRIYPRFGFRRIIEQAAFETGDRYGYFVSDEAVTDRILDLVTTGNRPQFVYAVTMENHNPWREGRIDGIDDPLEQYLHHAANADRMLGRLIDALDAGDREAVLCFYGDHVPILRAVAHPFPDIRTDYVILRCGPGIDPAAETGGLPRHAAIEDLMGMLMAVRV